MFLFGIRTALIQIQKNATKSNKNLYLQTNKNFSDF